MLWVWWLRLRSFLTNNASRLFAWARARFPPLLHHVASHFHFPHVDLVTLLYRLTHAISAIMGVRADSKTDSAAGGDRRPTKHMVHVKTKEECRLGTVTIQVWTVEMPSKHAEGVLKYLPSIILDHD